VLQPVETANGTGYQIESVQPTAQLCFDRSLASSDMRSAIDAKSTCEAIIKGAESSLSDASSFTFTRHDGMSTSSRSEIEVTIYARSTLDIIHFLGSLTKTGTPVNLVTDEARSFGSGPLGNRLFAVEVNSPSADDFVSVTYRGTRYSIPMHATSTIRIFALLRRLVALSTSLNSLPVSNTVTAVAN